MFEYKSTFFIVATPIGNLKDITYRAIETLSNVDAILCEDTRQTIKLLNRYSIKKPLISYHKYSGNSRDSQILKMIEDGKNVALVSDAGMPLLADPGDRLLKILIENKIKVEVIPGACSIINALVLSSANLGDFAFGGWMPKKSGQKIKTLKRFFEVTNTVVFLESPHRLKKTIDALFDASCDGTQDVELLKNIHISIAREMTKLHEEVLRGNIEFIKKALDKKNSIKGEIVLVFSLKSV